MKEPRCRGDAAGYDASVWIEKDAQTIAAVDERRQATEPAARRVRLLCRYGRSEARRHRRAAASFRSLTKAHSWPPVDSDTCPYSLYYPERPRALQEAVDRA